MSLWGQPRHKHKHKHKIIKIFRSSCVYAYGYVAYVASEDNTDISIRIN